MEAILRRRAKSKGILPNGYTAVDYITNPNSAMIRIDWLYLSRQDNITYKFIYDVAQSGDKWLFGATSDSPPYFWANLYSAEIYPRYGNTKAGYITRLRIDGNVKYIIIENGVWKYEQGTFSSIKDLSTEQNFAVSLPLTLFASNNADKTAKVVKLLGFDVEGKFKGVPVINKDGIYGLYDIIGRRFYGSANANLFTGGYL